MIVAITAACTGRALPTSRPVPGPEEGPRGGAPTTPAAPMTPAAATPPTEATPAAPPTPAAPTTARSYDLAACSVRLALMAKRLADADAAGSHDPAPYDYPRGAGDADLTGPDVLVELGTGARITGRGKPVALTGATLPAPIVKAVRKRMKAKDRLGVAMAADTPVADAAPLLEALAALGPLQVAVAVDGPPVPAWAAERLAIVEADPGRRDLLAEATRQALGTCAAGRDVFDPARFDASSKSRQIAEHLPLAIASCACQRLDVDATEALVATTIGGRATADTGWLAARFDPAAEAEVVAATVGGLVAQLAARPRADRLRPVKLVVGADPPAPGRAPTPAAPPRIAPPEFPPAPPLPAGSAHDCGTPCQDAAPFLGGKRWDYRKAAAIYRAACKDDYAGPAEACRRYALAGLWTRGATLAKADGILILAVACGRGDLAACAWAARTAQPGPPLDGPVMTALIAPCEAGDRAACEPLFLALDTYATRSACEPRWTTLAATGCAAGDLHACAFAYHLFADDCAPPASSKLTWEDIGDALERACAAGDPDACLELRPNDTLLWERRCEAGETFACEAGASP